MGENIFTGILISSLFAVGIIYAIIRLKFKQNDEHDFDYMVGLVIGFIMACGNKMIEKLLEKNNCDFFDKDFFLGLSEFTFIFSLFSFFVFSLVFFIFYFLKKNLFINGWHLLAELLMLFGINGIITGFMVAIALKSENYKFYIIFVILSFIFIFFAYLINKFKIKNR